MTSATTTTNNIGQYSTYTMSYEVPKNNSEDFTGWDPQDQDPDPPREGTIFSSMAKAKLQTRRWLQLQGLSYQRVKDGPTWVIACKAAKADEIKCDFRIRVNKLGPGKKRSLKRKWAGFDETGHEAEAGAAKLTIYRPHTCPESTHAKSHLTGSVRLLAEDAYLQQVVQRELEDRIHHDLRGLLLQHSGGGSSGVVQIDGNEKTTRVYKKESIVSKVMAHAEAHRGIKIPRQQAHRVVAAIRTSLKAGREDGSGRPLLLAEPRRRNPHPLVRQAEAAAAAEETREAMESEKEKEKVMEERVRRAIALEAEEAARRGEERTIEERVRRALALEAAASSSSSSSSAAPQPAPAPAAPAKQKRAYRKRTRAALEDAAAAAVAADEEEAAAAERSNL